MRRDGTSTAWRDSRSLHEGVTEDDSLNPKLRVTALGKYYNRRLMKKLGANQKCVVGQVKLFAKFVSC